jgi:hypothetical protein
MQFEVFALGEIEFERLQKNFLGELFPE